MKFTLPNVGIERFYHYHWREPQAQSDAERFDSGLLNPGGTTRAVYDVFKSFTSG
ncbi:MAG: hypothetical protein WD844_09335 [Thermoleophilaceae bacterium]